MNLGSLLVGLSLALVSAVAVADPLQRANRTAISKSETPRVSPGSQREQVLLALRDLDFDFRTGKIEEEDYQPLRRHLMAEAARLTDGTENARAGLEQEVESQEFARRGQLDEVELCPACGNEVRPADRYCSRCGTRQDRQCSACGLSIRQGDRFCAGCGSPTYLGAEG